MTRRPRAPWLTVADLYRIWACTARIPVAPPGAVPHVPGKDQR